MNFKATPLLLAMIVSSAFTHAAGVDSRRPTMEVLPGVTVSSDNIATSHVPGSEGGLTFTGNVAIVDASGTKTAAWAAFNPASMQLTVDGDIDGGAAKAPTKCGTGSCCRDGGYYKWFGNGEQLLGYPTRENPYMDPGTVRGLYCSGNFIRYL